MKTRYFWLSALWALLLLSACKPELDFIEGSLRPGSAEATLSGGNVSVNFTSSAGSASVDLKASGNWTATFVNDRAKDWCTFSTSEGKRGTATIKVSVKENSDYDQRSASINFVCGDLRRTILVTQKQKDALLVTSNRIDVGQAGGQITVEVQANIPFEYAISDPAKAWIKQVGTKGLTTSRLLFSVSANEDLEKREGEITVSSSAGKEVVRVYQEGGDPTIVLSQNRYAVTAEGGQVRVDVQSNIDVTLELPSACDWVRETSTKALSTSTFYLTVDENESFVERSCQLLFRAAAWGLEEAVTIVQEAARPQIILGTGMYEFGPEGGDLSIDVQSNFGITAIVPDTCAWIKAVETKSLTTKTFHFLVEANDVFDIREGKILFHNESLGITETVVVRQSYRDALFLSDPVIEVAAEGGLVEVQVNHTVDYTVSISDGWIQEAGTKSLQTDVLQFIVDPHTDLKPREGRVLFMSDFQTDTLLIKQACEPYYIKIVSPESRELSWDEGTLDIVLEHNSYGYRETQTIFMNENGAQLGDNYVFATGGQRSHRDDLRHTTVSVPYTRNRLRRARQAYLYYYNFDHSFGDTITFIQPPVPILTSDAEVTLPRQEGSFSFRLAGEDAGLYKLEFTDSWIHQTDVLSKSGETEYRWQADANPDASMRVAEIKIYRTDGGWPDVFRVCQEGSGLSFSVTYSGRHVVAPLLYGTNREQSTIWWGDGTSEPYTDGARHTYADAGPHTIEITAKRMTYVDWAEVSEFQDGMHIDFSHVRGSK